MCLGFIVSLEVCRVTTRYQHTRRPIHFTRLQHARAPSSVLVYIRILAQPNIARPQSAHCDSSVFCRDTKRSVHSLLSLSCGCVCTDRIRACFITMQTFGGNAGAALLLPLLCGVVKVGQSHIPVFSRGYLFI